MKTLIRKRFNYVDGMSIASATSLFMQVELILAALSILVFALISVTLEALYDRP